MAPARVWRASRATARARLALLDSLEHRAPGNQQDGATSLPAGNSLRTLSWPSSCERKAIAALRHGNGCTNALVIFA